MPENLWGAAHQTLLHRSIGLEDDGLGRFLLKTINIRLL